MAITNHERVGKALELLKGGLGPFIERELTSAYGDDLAAQAVRLLGEDRMLAGKLAAQWDSAALLRVMWDGWNDVFRNTLGKAERNLVSELRDVRNRWAHQQPFSSDDTYRALDSVARLLTAVSAPQTDEIERMRMELLRVRFDEQLRTERRRTTGTAIESQASRGLKPWREVVTPHLDVASGRYQQAEFAADLWQVRIGEGAAAGLVATLGSKAEVAREFACRLYTLCERRKRAPEAFAYNALVQSFPETTRLAHEGTTHAPEQQTLGFEP